ncbi:MAG: hypothetical protein KKI14_01245, partial [Nanoarchaeota archaeon]|nr:hypothetical protein [Nanoarchaeota archaeon]
KGSPTIIFTNKLVSEHTEFIENLIHIGIPKNIIKIHCYFNPNKISEFNAKKYIKKLLDDNMKVKLHPNPHDKKLIIGIQTSVDRAILAELLLNAMNKLRNYISTNEMLETSENRFAHHFLAKLLTGDGNFNIRTSGNNIVTCGYISDCDQSYRNDYKEILKKFKISVANYDKDGRTYFKCNEKNLYFLYRIEAFKGTKNWFKLLRAIIIKKKKQYLRLQTLNNLQVFTIKDIEDSCNISYLAARQWTRYNRKLGFIKMVDVKDKKYYLTLTKEAIGFLNLIDKCRHEFELEKTILEKSDMNEEFIKRNAVNL